MIGLCESCVHVRVVRSDRETNFYLCELSKTDSRYIKYPRLPMLECEGYMERIEASE